MTARSALASWRRYAPRDVRVTIKAPGEIEIHYIDGTGEHRARGAMTIARVQVLAMNWVHWALIDQDGRETSHAGYLHPDTGTDAAITDGYLRENERRELARDTHPRSRELSWRCYETALAYQARGINMGEVVAPKYPRPTAGEIAASPL